MADKRISQLIERVDIANNDVLPIVASGATTTNKVTISTIQDWMQENLDVGVTSVGITIGSTGTDVNVTGSPITTSGNITINIPTASATNRGLLSSSDWNTFTNQRVPYTGATGNVNLGEYGISTGYVGLDTTPTGTPASQGTIYWDDSRSTAALIMNGTTQHIGQDSFFYVKNSTGSTIAKGTAVGFAGTDGASGHLLVSPFLANGSSPSAYFMGVTAEAITNGGFGQVMQFGELSGVNTSGYTAGALLYASSTIAGAFQTTAPVAPNNIILVAAAVNSTNNGTIVVRPSIGSNINNDEGVKITSVADKDLLQYQSGTGLWENKTRENAGVVTTDTSQAITATKQFTQGLSLASAGGTNQLTVVKNIGTIHEGSAGSNIFGFNNSNNIYFGKGLDNGGVITWSNSAVRSYALPDSSGTIALTSNLSSYLPLSGGTLTGALNGTSASFDSTGTYVLSLNNTAQDTRMQLQVNGTQTFQLSSSSSQVNIFGATNIPMIFYTNATERFRIASTGAATFSGALNGTSASFSGNVGIGTQSLTRTLNLDSSDIWISLKRTGNREYLIGSGNQDSFRIQDATAGFDRLTISSTGAATFSSSVSLGADQQLKWNGYNSATAYITSNAGFNSNYNGVGIFSNPTNANSLPAWAVDLGGLDGPTIGGVADGFTISRKASGGSWASRFVINSTGNVGIGTTSPASLLHLSSASAAYQLRLESTTGTNPAYLGFKNTGGQYYIGADNSSGSALFVTGGSAYALSIVAEGSRDIVLGNNNAERMRITSGGNVGIGTSTFNYSTSNRGYLAINGTSTSILEMQNNSSAAGYLYAASDNIELTAVGASRFLRFTTNDVEKMRITSGGFLKASNTGSYSNATSSVHEMRSNVAGGALLVSNSNTSNPYGLAIVYSISPNNNAEFFIECADSSATRFIVRSNGNVSNTNGSYGAISDAKLKENIEDATPKLDDLMKVKVRNYNLIGEKTKQIGVIAQELEEVFPAMIEETPDFEEVEVPQVDEEGNEILNEEGEVVTTKEKVSKGTTTKSVKYSVFVPMLIKAMQEQQEQIKSLTEQVEALKSQING